MMPENIPGKQILPTRDMDFLALASRLAASDCQQNGEIAGATLGFTAAN
jgi:hypothetical protein